jgi:ParB-like nuclease domain
VATRVGEVRRVVCANPSNLAARGKPREPRTPDHPRESHPQLTDAPQSAGLVALADRIELWPIDCLRPYERNPRTHSEAQVDQIAASMVEFGWTNPILVDENAGILAGHGRLFAARKLGLAEVPIRFEHLSEAQKRAYLIADNQLALQAGWSQELLAQELAWLRDESFDLDLIHPTMSTMPTRPRTSSAASTARS